MNGTDGAGSWSKDAEQFVLGSVFRWPTALWDVRPVLDSEDFYTAAHQEIYRSMLRLADRGRPIDLVSVYEDLIAAGQSDDVSPALLGDIFDRTATGANAVSHAEIVRGHSSRRRVIHAANAVLREAQTPGDPAALLDFAEREILAATAARRYDGGVRLSEAVNRAMDAIDRRCAGEATGAIPTGLSAVDELTLGLHPSELVIVGARPSVGKTTLATTLLGNVLGGGLTAYFASLEQPAEEIATRMLVAEGRLDAALVRSGDLKSADVERASKAANVLREMGLYLSDSSYQTAITVASNARRHHHRHGIALVVVDYLQFLAPVEKRATKNEQVGLSAKLLKMLARELRIPVVVLAQLNRGIEGRGDNGPRLSDLRDSGEIEQHADLVLLMHRTKDVDHRIVEVQINVAKNRNGPTGAAMVLHHRHEMRFSDVGTVNTFGD